MKVIAETKNYICIELKGGDEGAGDFSIAMKNTLDAMEGLHDKYRPLHYLPRISAWVCEKK
jgi:hypothetical protein